MYLVDTNVISAGAPTKARPSPELIAWMDRNSQRLYLSVVTVAEIEDGIAKARRLGASSKADRLAEWLGTLLHLYGARVLALELATARMLGGLTDVARAAGHTSGLADLAIAATARRHGYTVLTRNLRHFAPLGIVACDPFETLPTDG